MFRNQEPSAQNVEVSNFSGTVPNKMSMVHMTGAHLSLAGSVKYFFP